MMVEVASGEHLVQSSALSRVTSNLELVAQGYVLSSFDYLHENQLFWACHCSWQLSKQICEQVKVCSLFFSPKLSKAREINWKYVFSYFVVFQVPYTEAEL